MADNNNMALNADMMSKTSGGADEERGRETSDMKKGTDFFACGMTRKAVVYVGIAIMSFMLCGCKGQANSAGDTPAADVLLGGWEIVSHDAEELPEDAQEAFDKAKKDLTDGVYMPVSLLATQVVAGTNYCILCQVTPDDAASEQKWTLVYIYADLQGNAEIMNTYDLYIARHSMPKE